MKPILTIPLSRGFSAQVSPNDFDELSKRKWVVEGYKNHIYAVSGNYPNRVRMHRVILNAPKNVWVDHINHNTLDNRRENLRTCSPSQNHANKRKSLSSSTSSYKGVCWKIKNNKWTATIKRNRQNIHIGYFDSEIDAAHAYDQVAKAIYGEFALLNFPPQNSTLPFFESHGHKRDQKDTAVPGVHL